MIAASGRQMVCPERAHTPLNLDNLLAHTLEDAFPELCPLSEKPAEL